MTFDGRIVAICGRIIATMRAALALSGVLAIAASWSAPAITSTRDLVDAMQKQYSSTWYKTATFVQKTSTFAPDGTVSKVETWYEAMSVPGSLRIDIAPVKDGNGILFTAGKVFNFKDGKPTSSREYIHPLMLLGFDVYRLPAAEVFAQLASLKFDQAVHHIVRRGLASKPDGYCLLARSYGSGRRGIGGHGFGSSGVPQLLVLGPALGA